MKLFDNIQKNPKNLLWIVGGIGGLVLIVWLGRKVVINLFQRSDAAKAKDLERAANKNIDTKLLSYSASYYQQLASKLYEAMRGVGTNDESIKEVMNALKNQSDYEQLIVSFGLKDGIWGSGFSNKNMIEWLINELSTSERTTIRKILNTKNIQTAL